MIQKHTEGTDATVRMLYFECSGLPYFGGFIDAGLKQAFRQHPQVRELLPQLTQQVAQGALPASTAARSLLAAAAITARP